MLEVPINMYLWFPYFICPSLSCKNISTNSPSCSSPLPSTILSNSSTHTTVTFEIPSLLSRCSLFFICDFLCKDYWDGDAVFNSYFVISVHLYKEWALKDTMFIDFNWQLSLGYFTFFSISLSRQYFIAEVLPVPGGPITKTILFPSFAPLCPSYTKL